MYHIPLIIGVLFGFGVGWYAAYYVFRIPQILGARKAARTRKLNKIKKMVRQRATNKTLNHTVGTAIVYYQKFSPEMFIGISTKDVADLVDEMAAEQLNEFRQKEKV